MIVRDGEVVATGVNQVTIDMDPSAHAEIVAIRAACRKLDNFKLDRLPAAVLVRTVPDVHGHRVVGPPGQRGYAADRDDAARAGFNDRDFYELFDKPRESWSMTVAQLSQVDGIDPVQPLARATQPRRILIRRVDQLGADRSTAKTTTVPTRARTVSRAGLLSSTPTGMGGRS